MSPILVRPVREQFEHDRVIRVLQARYKRKFEVAMNPGVEQNASVVVGDLMMHPDLLLYSQDRTRRLQGTIEVETTESINTLEAMAEWGPFSRLKIPFYLYVPPNSIDTVRRLCVEHQIVAAEIWTYHSAVDQIRFTMVQRAPEAAAPARRASKPAAKSSAKAAPKAPPKTVRAIAKAAPAKRTTAPARPARKPTSKPVASSAKSATASAGRGGKPAKRR